VLPCSFARSLDTSSATTRKRVSVVPLWESVASVTSV
jgi:hypothetical protein